MMKFVPGLVSEKVVWFVFAFSLLLALCNTPQALFVYFKRLKGFSNLFISKVFAVDHV